MYNPQPRLASHLVRLPVADNAVYRVTNDKGEPVEWQLVPIHPAVLRVPGRVSMAKFELVITAADLPGLSSRVYHVARSSASGKLDDQVARPKKLTSGHQPYIENDLVKVSVSPRTGFASIQTRESMTGSWTNVELKQEFGFYRSAVGDNSNFEARASGIY